MLFYVAPPRELSNLFYEDLLRLYELKPELELLASTLFNMQKFKLKHR